jgi:hypothetical protein
MPASFRNDDELYAIMRHPCQWVVNGQGGQVLGFASSLRLAIDRAAAFARSDAVVLALARVPFDNIVVGMDQVDRLRRRVMDDEQSKSRQNRTDTLIFPRASADRAG